MNVKINEHERVDDLHRNGYKLIQDPKNFCFGADAVLLSAFCSVQKSENVIDLGTGTGIIPILLAAKTNARHITGIDICEESVEMAQRSVLLNDLQEKITISHIDIKNVKNEYPAGSFNVVTSNPPYMEPEGGLKNDFSNKAAARHEILVTLAEVLDAAKWLLRFGGRLYMIHRPHRIVDIMCLMRERGIEPKRLRFVHPFKEKPPAMLLIEATSGGKAMARVESPLIMYEKQNVYTEEVFNMYYK